MEAPNVFARYPLPATLVVLVLALGTAVGAADVAFDRYHQPEERAAALREMAAANPGIAPDSHSG